MRHHIKGRETYTTPSGVFIQGIDETKKAPDGKYYYVYCVVNLRTQHLYIGKRTSTNLYDSYVGSGKALKDAVRKYGKHNFGRSILEYTNSEAELHSRELYYIKEVFNAAKNPLCYNLIEDSGTPRKGYIMSEETKKKLSLRFKGTKITEATKLKIRLGNLGKRMSDEAKSKISKAAKGRVISGDQRRQISDTLKLKYQDVDYRSKVYEANLSKYPQVHVYEKDGTYRETFKCLRVFSTQLGLRYTTPFFRDNYRYCRGLILSYIKVPNILEVLKYDPKIKKYVEI